MIFCDDPAAELEKLGNERNSDRNSSLSIFLPHHFRLPVQGVEPLPAVDRKAEDPPTTWGITVTLLYPTNWWRFNLMHARDFSPTNHEFKPEGDNGATSGPPPPPRIFSLVLENGHKERGLANTFWELKCRVRPPHIYLAVHLCL